MHWYGKLYQPTGGQRCIEGSCTDFETPLAAQGRQTGRQIAYGQHQGVAYLALDLAPAYESRALGAYTREFVFLFGRVLVVVDRVTQARSRSVPTWVMNVPARPLADGQKLSVEARVTGETDDAGVWRCDDATWLRWTDRDGSLWLNAPLPTPKCLRVVGGPAQEKLLKDDTRAGRTYVGGEANGFERLIIPAERRGALNAWYRLGKPTLLGPDFGHTPHWGRIEIEPNRQEPETMFVTVLVTDRADASLPPSVQLLTADATHVLSLKAGEQSATLRLGTGMQQGGSIEVSGAEPLFWKLPTEVMPDQPLD